MACSLHRSREYSVRRRNLQRPSVLPYRLPKQSPGNEIRLPNVPSEWWVTNSHGDPHTSMCTDVSTLRMHTHVYERYVCIQKRLCYLMQYDTFNSDTYAHMIHTSHHPLSVYPDGKVCISILHPPGEDEFNEQEKAEERWRPIISVEAIIVSVISMLGSPNVDSPANLDAAVSDARKESFVCDSQSLFVCMCVCVSV